MQIGSMQIGSMQRCSMQRCRLVGVVLIAVRDDASHIDIAELLAGSGHASAKDGSTGLSAPSP